MVLFLSSADLLSASIFLFNELISLFLFKNSFLREFNSLDNE